MNTDYWNIFWKTFAQLAAAGLLAVQGLALSFDDYTANAVATGLVLFGALVGAVIAVGTAYARSPASTPLQKATRSAVQAVVGLLGLLAYNSFDEVVDTGRLVVAGLGGVVLAFAITFFQNQGEAPETPIPQG